MENRKSIGLPGGPNEFLKEITQHISVEGYKRYSKDVNNPYNIIESGNITMEDVDFPVKGTDNLGNEQMMMPGMNYQFPGNQVFEVPMAQYGFENKYALPVRNGVRLNYDEEGNVNGESTHIMRAETLDGKNWFSFPSLFQNEDGTWVDMSTSLEKDWMPVYEEAKKRGEVIEFGTDRESAIKFGEGSWKPKAQVGGEQATLSAYEEPAWYEKAVDYLASPMTALGYLARGQDVPANLPINMEERNAHDSIIDTFNPFAWIKYGAQANRDLEEGEYLDAGLNILGALPIVPAWLSKTKKVLPPAVVNKIATYTDDVVKGANNFESSIDWRKWVKYTDDFDNNPDVIKHLNEIEKTTKGNGTWMKNSDGSAFKGTQEEFVIQQSDNFKKAFPNPIRDAKGNIQTNYHGSPSKLKGNQFAEYHNPENEIGTGIYTTSKKNYAQWFSENGKPMYGQPKKPTIYELYQNSNNPQLYPEHLVGTDEYVKMFNRGDFSLKEGFDSFTKRHQSIVPFNNYPKSAKGNILLDMINPNIYKAIVPGTIGVGAASQMTGPVQEDGQYQQGGSIPKAQDGNGEYKSEDITKEGFDWGGYFSGEQGWIPDYDGVPTLQMFDEQPVKQEVVEKKPEILTAAYLENYLAESRGRTPDFWRHSADTIAFHESGPLQRMDPQAIQKSYTKDGVKYDGPGRGMFQFENGEAGGQESFQTAQKRYNATAKARGVSPDSEIMNASSPLDLSADQQYALFYANIIQDEKVKLADYANGNMTLTDLWLVGHKKIEKPGNRNAFAASVEEAKKGIIKKQYGGSNLPNYQLKGEVNYNYNWKSADSIEKYRTPIDNTYVNIPLQRFESINNNKKETDSIGEYVPFNVMDMPQMQQAQDNTYVNPYKINKKDIVNLTPEDIEEINTASKILDREYNDPRDPWVSNAIKNANNFKTGWKDYSNAPEEEIRKLQQELINNGYDVGSTKDDGVFGSKTQAAYSAMVEDKNLDLKSVDRYFGDYSTKNKEEVMQIQNQLIDLGFLPDKELNGKNNLDGKFGPRTKEALLEYNTTLNEEDSSALIFDSIPSTLEDPRCASGMCAILEKNNVQTEALGIKYKDAWDILENMKISKNSEVLFNIYDEPEFANVNQNTSVEELKNITNKVKQRKQTNKSDYKVGDIIGIYWPGSDKHNQTLNSKTFNTHTGFVSDIDEKGNPIITHNVNGKVKQQPYTQLQTSWIARPNENIKLNTIYDVAGIENISNDLGPILNLENKWGAKISDNRGNQIQNILKRATYNADKIPQILNSSVNNEWLKHATFAITGVESGIGKDDVTPRTLEEAGFNSGIKQLAYKYKGTKPEDVSLGIGKIKYSTLDGFEKEYFNIDSYKDLADDNKSTDLVSYRLTKNYEIFKDYAKQYPELGLSEEDIRNMSILAHNQGNSKLLKIGKNATSFLLPAEQVKELRKLYEGTINDVSSTNYKYIPGGEKIYNAALAIGAEDEAIPYIRKVNDYINQVFQPMSSTAIASVSSAQKQDPFSKQSLAKGGEYGVFNNYINGDYNNTLREAAAEKVYDKLNRLHYKDAKALGMSPANYILTHVMAKA